jgi:glycosyltransferase involved in cell wall biosynthesis
LKSEILFISRNYPPQIGGLETYSYNLIKHVGHRHVVSKIVLGKPKIHLLWFIPYALYRAIWLIRKEYIHRVHLCDGFLAPLGLLLKFFLPVKVTITIHGLDITFKRFFYQEIIPRCVSRLDKIICVSRHTQEECVSRGIPVRKTAVIPNGVNPKDFEIFMARETSRVELGRSFGFNVENRKILLTVGRLVPRKGVAWFVREVIPRLDDSYCYFIVGDGPDIARVSGLVSKLDLRDQVFVLGRVNKGMQTKLLQASDVFVMPNIKVDGDVEGFGIAAIEAGCCGLPVIASDLQGLRDAVLHGKTGFLVEPENREGFVEGIKKMDLSRDAIRMQVVKTFDWQRVSGSYEEALGLFPGVKPVRQ